MVFLDSAATPYRKNFSYKLGGTTSALLIAVSLFFTAPVPAYGQKWMEEILVTARKREETTLEIPESISVITASDFEKGELTKMEDIGNLVPNLNLNERGDGTPNVSIRGVGAFGNTRGVGFYVDGAEIFDDTAARWGDIERIEVLKGPQGTLYGGSNIGGALKWVTKRPDPTAASGRVEGEFGSYDTVDLEASLNLPLSDTWATRLFAYHSSDNGFVTNHNLPRITGGVNQADPDLGATEEKGVRLSFAGDLSESLSVFAALRRTELTGPRNEGLDEIDANFEFSNDRNLSFNPVHNIETSSASLQFDYDLDFATLTYLTSYTDSDTTAKTDGDLSQEIAVEIPSPESSETITQELRITSNTDGPLEWLGGLYYLDRDFFRDFELHVFCLALPFCGTPTDINGNTVLVPQTPAEEQFFITLPFEQRDQETSRYAAFGDLTYRFGSFEIEGGLRLERWERETRHFLVGDQSTTLGVGNLEDTEYLPKVSLSYFFDDERSMAYASFARGFEPGGFNLVNFSGSNELFAYDTEEADTLELGYKGRLYDNKVHLSLAAFFIENRDRQFEDIGADPVSGQLVEGVLNIGDSEQYGLEADITWYLTEKFDLTLSASVIEAEWKDGTVLSVGSGNQVVPGADISGLTPPFVNDFGFVAVANYETSLPKLAFGDDMLFWTRAQLSVNGEQQTNLTNTIQNDTYTIANLDFGIKPSDERWEFAVHIENLFDEEYFSDIRPIDNFNPVLPVDTVFLGNRGLPRWVTASLTVNF